MNHQSANKALLLASLSVVFGILFFFTHSLFGITELTVQFIDTPTTIHGVQRITVAVSALPDLVEFYVSGTNTGAIPSQFINKEKLTYGFDWNTTTIADGLYTIKAKAYESSALYQTASISVAVQNSTTSQTTETPPLLVEHVKPPLTASGTVTLYGKTNQPVSKFKFRFFYNGALVIDQYATQIDATNYSYRWDTTKTRNGTYVAQALAFTSTATNESNVEIKVGNSESTTTQTNSTTTATFSVTLGTLPTQLSGTYTLSAVTTLPADSVKFHVGEKSFTAKSIDATHFLYDLDTTPFTNGTYTFSVSAYREMITKEDQKVSVIYNNTTVAPTPIGIQFLSPSKTASGTVTISAQTNTAVDSVVFNVNGHVSASYLGSALGNNTYSFVWDTTAFPNGTYLIEAKAKRNTETLTQSTSIDVYNSPEPVSVETLEITFLNPPPKANEIIHLEAKTSFQPDSFSFEIAGPQNKTFTALNPQPFIYAFNWDTKQSPNGTYTVSAIGTYKGARGVTNVHIEVQNATTSTTTSPLPPPAATVKNLDIAFVNPPAKISLSAILEAKTNIKPDDIIFDVSGPKNAQFKPLNPSSNIYKLIWDTTTFPNGSYTVSVRGTYNGSATSRQIQVELFNETITSTPALSEEASATQPLSVTFITPLQPLQKDAVITVRTSAPQVEKSIFIIDGPKPITFNGTYVRDYTYSFSWYTRNFPNGRYTLKAHIENKGKTASSEISVEIKNVVTETPPKTSADLVADAQGTVPKGEAEEKALLSEQSATKFLMPSYTMPLSCMQAGINTQSDCDSYLIKMSLPYSCREANIETRAKCDTYLITLHLPLECNEAGVSDPNQCDAYLFDVYGKPDQCANLSNDQCKERIEDIFVSGGLFTPIESVENIRIEKLPLECKEAGITTFQKCHEYMEKLYIPQECKDHEITTAEECQTYMEERYGLPKECAGLTKEQCQKQLSATPSFTAAQIVAKNQTPRECRESGITSLSECEKLMREKYMANLCYQNRARSKQACKEMMIEAYGEPAACEKKTSTECLNLIYHIILADFVPQSVHEESQKRIQTLANKHLAIEKIPFVDGAPAQLKVTIVDEAGQSIASTEITKTVEKVLPLAQTEEKMRVAVRATKENELSQTLFHIPALFIFDQDRDGLPDEVEQRLGTDPNNKDSDGDGYSDGVEVATDHNPLGERAPKQKPKPVEKALAKKVPLEQPKTAGVTDSVRLKVLSVTQNTLNQKNISSTPLTLKGIAPPNEVATLFIYSPMPIVITVTTDSAGNWVYHLDKTLVDGKHESFVVIHDENGVIQAKSAPVPFFIETAQAISEEEFLKIVEPLVEIAQSGPELKDEIVKAAPDIVPDPTKSMIRWYIIASIVFAVMAVILYFLNNKMRNNAKKK